ncbi:DUF481 domain-containing protein [Thiotrichales bacterium 19S11-10]|nr:DUF481 domain-containing protein [Thiotrichales bacterium 19S11-10]
MRVVHKVRFLVVGLVIVFGYITPISLAASNVSAQEAKNLATKYQALAKYYEDLAKSLTDSSGGQIDKEEEKVSETTTKKQAGGSQTLDEIAKKQAASPFSGTNASLGAQYNTGNTAQRNIAAAMNLNYKQSKKVLHTLTANYQNAFDYDTEETTTNKFFASAQSEYNFNQYNGLYANLQYLNDQKSGYVYQINENVGYRRRLYQRNGMSFDLFFGPGMQQTRETQDTGGGFSNEPSVQVKTQYKWKLNDKSNYNQILQWIKTPRHYTVGLTMALTTSIYNSFGLQPSFTLSYDSNPPTKSNGSQLKKVDTTTQLSLVYNF